MSAKKVHFVSLGCAKNQVDSEVMLGHLAGAGFVLADEAEQAEIIVVNTCGFVDAAKQESIDVILDMARLKQEGRCKTLVVAGCLSQRYAPELRKELPEVDHFVGTGNFEQIATLVGAPPSPVPRGRLKVLGSSQSVGSSSGLPTERRPKSRAATQRHRDPDAMPPPQFTLTAATPRLRTGPWYTAYVKIAEGCSNQCAFCTIPAIRGPQRSRTIRDIVTEVEQLAAAGVVEVNLIAQDLCAFGKDRAATESLSKLLVALDETAARLGRPHWIRCLYLYPRGLTTELLDVMSRCEHVLPYFDMPLQHISDPILRAMKRGKGGPATRALIERVRERVPKAVLRTAFIVGLPGETDARFVELCDFVTQVKFDHVGVFAYSREEETPAAHMAHQVEAAIALERRDYLMGLQRRISHAKLKRHVGKRLQVLVEGVSQETELLLQGRAWMQAPEVDGVTYINSGTASPGELVEVRVEQALDYDLVGGIVEPNSVRR